MSSKRLQAITQIVNTYNETDQYDEDLEKTALVEELLAEVERLSASQELAV